MDLFLYAPLVTVGLALIPPLIGAIATGVGIIGAGLVADVVGVPLAIGAAITLGVIAIAKLIEENFDNAYTSVIKWGDTINNAVGSFFQSIWDTFSGFFKSLASGFSDLVNAIGSPGGVITDALSGIGSFLGVGYQGRLGDIPDSASGFMGAIARESRNAPSGAGLVLANSSESIFTPSQLASLVAGSYSAGSVNTHSQDLRKHHRASPPNPPTLEGVNPVSPRARGARGAFA